MFSQPDYDDIEEEENRLTGTMKQFTSSRGKDKVKDNNKKYGNFFLIDRNCPSSCIVASLIIRSTGFHRDIENLTNNNVMPDYLWQLFYIVFPMVRQNANNYYFMTLCQIRNNTLYYVSNIIIIIYNMFSSFENYMCTAWL